MLVVFRQVVDYQLIVLVFRWGSMTPLRQFKGVPQEVIRKAEGKQFVGLH
jgi:hypothetical protein